MKYRLLCMEYGWLWIVIDDGLPYRSDWTLQKEPRLLESSNWILFTSDLQPANGEYYQSIDGHFPDAMVMRKFMSSDLIEIHLELDGRQVIVS